MATTCRWQEVAQDKVPAYFSVEGKLNTSVLHSPAEAMDKGVISMADLTFMMSALVRTFTLQGEDAADAEALVSQGNAYVGSYGGGLYAFFDTAAGVFVYKQVCGLMANLPWVLGGAVLFGGLGAVWGYTRKGMKKKIVPLAMLGVVGGGLGGYLAARLMIDKATRSAEKMGLLSVRLGAAQRRRRFR